MANTSSMGGLFAHGLCAPAWMERCGFEPCSLVRHFHSASLHPGLAVQKLGNAIPPINHCPVGSRGLFCFGIAIHMLGSAIHLSINWPPGVKMDTGQLNTGG